MAIPSGTDRETLCKTAQLQVRSQGVGASRLTVLQIQQGVAARLQGEHAVAVGGGLGGVDGVQPPLRRAAGAQRGRRRDALRHYVQFQLPCARPQHALWFPSTLVAGLWMCTTSISPDCTRRVHCDTRSSSTSCLDDGLGPPIGLETSSPRKAIRTTQTAQSQGRSARRRTDWVSLDRPRPPGRVCIPRVLPLQLSVAVLAIPCTAPVAVVPELYLPEGVGCSQQLRTCQARTTRRTDGTSQLHWVA